VRFGSDLRPQSLWQNKNWMPSGISIKFNWIEATNRMKQRQQKQPGFHGSSVRSLFPSAPLDFEEVRSMMRAKIVDTTSQAGRNCWEEIV